MEEQKETPPPIIDQLKEYAETQIKLAKYEAIDRSAKFLASFITDMVVALAFVLTFLFLSFALAFILSRWLGSNWAGFGCMAGIYLIIAIIIILLKDKMQQPLINLFIRKFFQ
ncbi:phage holin family protein [Mucilaginibacter sp. McL0603]|uniref:phage holin family protein n=1 Tax=Mucilaginibacter sp. McL0603 TaxID=3415670 RepID=UPI003CFA1638